MSLSLYGIVCVKPHYHSLRRPKSRLDPSLVVLPVPSQLGSYLILRWGATKLWILDDSKILRSETPLRATNSGKTTSATKLCQLFPTSSTMCQDNYFREPDDPRLEVIEEVNHANWEKLSAMNMDLMMEHVHMWIQAQQARGDNSCQLLLIEGILIFNHKPLSELFDKKYFFSLDKETCKDRRIERNYIPADPPGYFDKVVWPMYLQNLDELQPQSDICYISGTEDQDTVINTIKQDIQKLMKTS